MRMSSLIEVGFTLCLLISSTLGQGLIDPIVREEIKTFIRDVYLPAAGLTNLGLSIVENGGQAVYSAGFGWADQEQGKQMGTQTQLCIGSITKSMTATLAVKILSETFPELGMSVLETPIRKLIPSFNFTLIDRFRSEHVTFRDLLGHRVCTPTDDVLLTSDPFNTTDEIVYRQRYSPEICGVRGEMQYNNEMLVVAGHLVGAIANRPYEDLILELLAEIGMTSSTFATRDDDYDSMDRAKPYYVTHEDMVSHPMNTQLVGRLQPFSAAGGMCATSSDMTRYLEFHLNRGLIGGRQVVPEEVMRWLTTPSIQVPGLQYKQSDSDKVTSLHAGALGLVLGTYDGWEFITHSGYFPAYSSLMSMYPHQKIGVFSSTNQGQELVSQTELHAFIFEKLKNATSTSNDKLQDRLLSLREKTINKIQKKKETRNNFKISTSGGNTAKQSEFVGQYGNGASGDMDISERFNEATNTTLLYMSHGRWFRAWLYPVEDNEVVNFVLGFDSDMVQDFYAAGDDGVGSVFANIGNGTVEFFQPLGDGVSLMKLHTKFELGVNLGTLPPIPWDPESCGSE